MNLAENKLARQGAAVMILVVVLLAAWTVLVQPFVAIPLARSTEIADLSNQIASMHSLEEHGPRLKQRQAAVLADITRLQVLWHGTNRTQIAAAMQDVIRTATQQSGGQVVSASIMEEAADQGTDRLSVRTRVEGTLGTLQHVLRTLETTRARLFVDNLIVNTSEATSARDHAQRLTFELGVSAYLASGGPVAATP